MSDEARIGYDQRNDLVSALTTAAREMSGPPAGSEQDTLSWIVAAAVDTIPGAEQAGVSLLLRDGSITSSACSDATVSEVDQLQSTYREGPCVTALWDQHTVVVDDLGDESSRWPRFAPEAASAGVGSMLSFQLFTRENTLGALSLYASLPKSFSVDSRTLGGLFAAHAAAALGETQHIAQLHRALATRDVIGQAKGILMNRFDIDAEQAFAMLVRSSQETNMKLIDVARWLTGSASEHSDE